jgi:hypothetical protein
MTLSEVSMPKQHSIISLEMPSDEESHTMSKPSYKPNTFDTTLDDYSVSDAALQVSKNSCISWQNQAFHTTDEVTPVEPTVTTGTSQRGQVCTMSQRMAESVSQQNFYGDQGMHYMASQATTGDTDEDLIHNAHLQLQERMRNPITFYAEMMGEYILYLQQALKQPNAKEFVKVVIKEVNGHVDSNNWMLRKQSKVPEVIQIVPSVWSLWRKRDLITNKVKSHKARLNLHGGKQVYGMKYFETYALVVTWFAIRLMIIFRIIFCWALWQVDFFMAYPQAPIKMDINMELPQGIQTKHGNSRDHVLKLEKNIYGQKQAGGVWNSFLLDKLTSIGFTMSLIDDSIFFRDDIIFMV